MTSPATKISVIVSDLDGTLVTTGKKVTVISSRPPRGMAPVLKTLKVVTPSAGFNGGVIVAPDQTVLKQHLVSPTAARRAIGFLTARGIDARVFRGPDWLIRNPTGPHVEHETHTVGIGPVVVADFAKALDTAAKILGVSDNHAFLQESEGELAALLSDNATVARSRLYYLDVTDRLANKSQGLLELAKLLGVAGGGRRDRRQRQRRRHVRARFILGGER